LNKLPNAENAIIEESKVIGYLLNFSHPNGWSKAKFFSQLGFNLSNWPELIQSLRLHIDRAEVFSIQQTTFGTKYVLQGEFSSVKGKTYLLRTVWFVGYNEDTPKLVTAYPIQQ
jgi:hypothetical protein